MNRNSAGQTGEEQQLSRIFITGKGPFKGEIETPSDKSISHRAVIFASLAEGGETAPGQLTVKQLNEIYKVIDKS